jgi:hypothetical protein
MCLDINNDVRVSQCMSNSVASCIVTGGTHSQIRLLCLMHTVLALMLFVKDLMLKSSEFGFRSSMQEGVHNLLLIFATSSPRECQLCVEVLLYDRSTNFVHI